MKRLLVALLALGLSLAGLANTALGQQPGGPVVYDDDSGANGSCTVSGAADEAPKTMLVPEERQKKRGVTARHQDIDPDDPIHHEKTQIAQNPKRQ